MKVPICAAVALALLFFPAVFLSMADGPPATTTPGPGTGKGSPEFPAAIFRVFESAVPAAHAQEAQDQTFMLEHADAPLSSNGCFEAMMAMGCRIQSQIPVWNRFAGIFAIQFGISCPSLPDESM